MRGPWLYSAHTKGQRTSQNAVPCWRGPWRCLLLVPSLPVVSPAILVWAVTCDFQQCGISTSVDSDEPVQPPFKLRISKCCSVSSSTIIKYTNDKQRLWSDWAYVQADLRLSWSHIPHCWKSHALAHFIGSDKQTFWAQTYKYFLSDPF